MSPLQGDTCAVRVTRGANALALASSADSPWQAITGAINVAVTALVLSGLELSVLLEGPETKLARTLCQLEYVQVSEKQTAEGMKES